MQQWFAPRYENSPPSSSSPSSSVGSRDPLLSRSVFCRVILPGDYYGQGGSSRQLAVINADGKEWGFNFENPLSEAKEKRV